MKRLPAIAALIFAVLCALAAQQAAAYRIAGKPWPSNRITYYSTGDRYSERLVDRAARIWNRAHVGVRFERSRSTPARVVVSGISGACRGEAEIGYPGERSSWLYVARCPDSLMVLVLAHEFGHVLGLAHEPRKCALMNPGVDPITGTPSHCHRHRLSYWLKHPLTADDIRGARAITGRR